MRDLGILESWKEISDYLKKAERTCRRWEQEFSLPVHRMDGSPKARVFAYKHELDQWIQEMLNTADDSEKRRISFRSLNKLFIPGLVVALAVIGIVIWQLLSEKEAVIAPKKMMIVVLPFENLGLAEDEYFADGVTEEITSRLAALHELGVISRSSANRYKKTEKTIKEMGEELSVDFVLEGSVRWDRNPEGGGKVRVTPQLIRVSDDTQLWSDRYDREIEDIFAVQSDIAEQVIRQLDITLLEPEQRILKAKPTDNLEAYQAYLRGIVYAKKPGFYEEKYRLQVQMFERAIELDPNFVQAYARLSLARSVLFQRGYDRSEENILKAKAAADRALELQPELPEGHMALGMYYYYCHKDYDRALEELALAAKDMPNNREILMNTGFIRRRQGNFEEAASAMKKALEFNPRSTFILTNLGETYRVLRKHQEAGRYFDRSISLAPDQRMVYRLKTENYQLQGSLEKARLTLEEMPRKTDTESIRSWHINWVWQEIYERNYQAALKHVSSDFVELFAGEKAVYKGIIYHCMNEPELARDSFDTARMLLEREAEEKSDHSYAHSWLGIAYAGIGLKEEAIWQGKRAVELYSVSKDAYEGPDHVFFLALIYVILGEYKEALDQIEYLLSIPSYTLSVPLLRIDPMWDPLREHPRFKRLLEENSQDDS